MVCFIWQTSSAVLFKECGKNKTDLYSTNLCPKVKYGEVCVLYIGMTAFQGLPWYI